MKKLILASVLSLIVLLATSCFALVSPEPDGNTIEPTPSLTGTSASNKTPGQTPPLTPVATTAKVVKVYGSPG